MVRYVKADDARILRENGDREIAETLAAYRVTTAYEARDWELEAADDRLAFYQNLGAIGQIRQASRDKLIRFVLSFESIVRRKRCVAIAVKPELWAGKISSRLPRRFVDSLCDQRLLLRRNRQVSRKPNVFDPSPEFMEQIPALPEGAQEGKLRSDKPWQPVEIKPARTEEDAERFGPRALVFGPQIEDVTREVEELNQWYADNAHRVHGLDDLRFHRVFHHSLLWGGRLYGQFTHMQREERANILIDGEPTEEADLSGSYLSFFLLQNGWDELPDDPYQHGDLAQFDRRFVKEVVLRLFGKGKWWDTSYNRALNPIRQQLGYPEALPPYQQFQTSFIETYPVFEGFDQFKPTLKIENSESRALLNTLVWLRDQNEVGLPIHDGIRVRLDIRDEAQDVFSQERLNAFR